MTNLAEEYTLGVLDLSREIWLCYINVDADCKVKIDYLPNDDVKKALKKANAGYFRQFDLCWYFIPNVEHCRLYKKALQNNKEWKASIDEEIKQAARLRNIFGMRSKASVYFRGNAIIDSVRLYMKVKYPEYEPQFIENPNNEFTLIVRFN